MGFKVNKNIEKPAYIFGIPTNEIILVPVIPIILWIIGIAMQSIFNLQVLGKIFFVDVFLLWFFFLVLKWATGKRYPGFLVSFIAYRFLQKRKIEPRGFRLEIKKNKK